ncbi:MAG: hypothetical protein ABSB56_08225 [Nitrososphaerales archaeon]
MSDDDAVQTHELLIAPRDILLPIATLMGLVLAAVGYLTTLGLKSTIMVVENPGSVGSGHEFCAVW